MKAFWFSLVMPLLVQLDEKNVTLTVVIFSTDYIWNRLTRGNFWPVFLVPIDFIVTSPILFLTFVIFYVNKLNIFGCKKKIND